MTTWNPDTLNDIATSDDLHISPFREDGRTYGTPTWIWSVVVDGRLFVRAWNGTNSRWYKAALSQQAGRVMAGGHTLDVSFRPVGTDLASRIDAAYSAKYADSPYLPPMLAAGPTSATTEIVPAD